MSKRLKRIAVALGVLFGVAVTAATILAFVGGSRLNRHYDIAAPSIAIPNDEPAVARGRHIARAVSLCHGCHGDSLQGAPMVEAPLIATIYASNLTPGRGGIGGVYSDADFVRAIRHGVNRDGRGLMIMHSDAYNNLAEADLAALVAYIRSVAPVDHEVPRTKGAIVGRIMVALGLFENEAMPLIPAEVIDHNAPLPGVQSPGATAEYGRYLVSIALCSMCHGDALTGGPPIEASAPPAPNIAMHGAPGGWTLEQFISTIRTGVVPDGRVLNADVMPWQEYAGMTDEELQAIWLYLGALGGEGNSTR
jgi:cytochrome c5